MSDTRPIIIAVFGLSPREEKILQTICVISKTRARTYELMPADGSEQPDIAILDAHDPQVFATWQQFGTDRPMLPLMVIGEDLKLDRPIIRIDRPLLATKLLAVFDQIQLSSEHPAFAPPDTKDKAQAHDVAKTTQQPKADSLSALVVDDSLPIRLQMQKELGAFVGNVDLAETGEQAIELVGKNDYDIVFLDVVLPGMDGYQICKTIKREKRTKNIPVVMLTGKSSPFDRVRGKLAGCDTYLTKPVDLPTFKEIVQQYLLQKIV
jgi:twitching motility two-component system response regulator PilG